MVNKLWLIITAVLILSCKKNSAQGTWHNLDGGVSCDTNIGNCYPSVRAICADTVNNVLYVGGAFNEAGNMEQVSISKWDGTKWDSLTERIPNVTAMIMYKGSLYVGIANVGFIVKFDGANWINLPMVNGEVYCFTIYKDTLYAGGTFTTNDSGVTLNNIAKWSGTDWLPLGTGIYGSCCPAVNAMAAYNDTLFVGGYFTNAGNQLTQSIAAWDGTNWLSLKNGVKDGDNPGFVFAMDTFKEKLYVGGEFDSAGSKKSTFGIADWNSQKWDTLPSAAANDVFVLKSFAGNLFIGGAGDYIYKYDGINVSVLDSGVNAPVYSLTAWNASLYVGGEFNIAGWDGSSNEDTTGKTVMANHIVQWIPDTATGIKQLTTAYNQLTIFPNPFSDEATVQLSKPINNNAQLTIYDLMGRKVENYVISGGSKNLIIQRNNLPAGMYFYKMQGNGMPPLAGKVVIE